MTALARLGALSLLVLAACGENQTTTTQTGPDAASLAAPGARRAALGGWATFASISVETRYWDSLSVVPAPSAALAAFNALPTNVAGYSNAPVTVYNLNKFNNAVMVPGGAAANIATRYTVTITSLGASEMAVRFGPDYGKGGVMMLDGVIVASDTADIFWNGYWDDPRQFFQATLPLTDGLHTLTVVGFENCCDGWPGAQYNLGAGWVEIATNAPPPEVFDGVTTVQSMTMETRYWNGAPFTKTGAGAMAAFDALPTNVPGYTNTPIRVSALGRNTTVLPGGALDNIGTRFRIVLNTTGTKSKISFRIGPDYSAGGVMLVDGVEVASNWSDFWYEGYWSNTASLLTQSGIVLQPGTHVVEVVGFEECCDAPAGAQFDLGGGLGWQDVAALVPAVPNYLVAVSPTGTGSGAVTAAPFGIACGDACSYSYPAETQLSFVATPASGSTFAGWSGACTGLAACNVTVRGATTLSAQFQRITRQLTLTRSGTGSGAITSDPAGINCGTDCSATFVDGTSVTLTATPAAGSTFTGWTGACTGTGTCTVTLAAAATVGAQFTRILVPLTITASGTGGGTITSSPAGINCGATCTASFAQGVTVTLTAAPAIGSSFAGWTGACAGMGTCTVPMNAAASVGAQFTKLADSTPPSLSCAATPSELWPANHKLRDIVVKIAFTDAGSGTDGYKLVSVTSSEPDDADESKNSSSKPKGEDEKEDDDEGDGHTTGDIAGWTTGVADLAGFLRAERAGNGPGRVYTLTYEGSDKAGNTAIATCKVTVPHDKRD